MLKPLSDHRGRLTLVCVGLLLTTSACAPTRMVFAPTVASAASGEPPPPPPELFLPADGRAEPPIQVAELEAYARATPPPPAASVPAPSALALLGRPEPAPAASASSPARPAGLRRLARAVSPRRARPPGSAQAAAPAAPLRLASSGGKPAHAKALQAPGGPAVRLRAAVRARDDMGFGLLVRMIERLSRSAWGRNGFVLAAAART